MALPQHSEHRHDLRRRVYKGASILSGIDNSEVQCLIRNMSDGGAELRITPGPPIPGEFLLYVPIDDVCYKAVVRWRDGARIGVMFAGKAEKPHWHYGGALTKPR